jgi:hypothetical protein
MNPEINEPSDKKELSWRIHPLTESVTKSVLVIGFILVICAIVYISFKEIFWVVLSLLFLLVSLSPFFLPTKFTLNNNEVIVKRVFTLTRPWDRFRGFYWDNNGVQLTPFTYPSRLDSYRGLFLKFDKNKDDVIGFIKEHLSPVNNDKPENTIQDGE